MPHTSNGRLDVNGVGLRIERSGSGTPLLFLNGSGSSIASSEPLLRHLRELGELITLDHRGMGESTSPPGPWTMADYAGDALAAMDQLGIATFDLLGVSFGGMVAQELAVTSPQRIRRLVLWSTSAGGSAGSSYPLQDLAAMSAPARDAMSLRLLDSRFDDDWLAEHPGDRALVDAVRPNGAVETDEQHEASAKQLVARGAHDVSQRLARLVDTPTLVGVGRFDLMAPPANAEAIASLAKADRFELYEGGHLFFFQDPRAFADLELFLD